MLIIDPLRWVFYCPQKGDVMRKKKFSKERFYRRLEAQNKNRVTSCNFHIEALNHQDVSRVMKRLRADGLFFNTQNSVKQPEPKPEFVPPPPLEKIGASEPNNDSGLFGWCFLHMAAIVACALLLCGILQKLSH